MFLQIFSKKQYAETSVHKATHPAVTKKWLLSNSVFMYYNILLTNNFIHCNEHSLWESNSNWKLFLLPEKLAIKHVIWLKWAILVHLTRFLYASSQFVYRNCKTVRAQTWQPCAAPRRHVLLSIFEMKFYLCILFLMIIVYFWMNSYSTHLMYMGHYKYMYLLQLFYCTFVVFWGH